MTRLVDFVISDEDDFVFGRKVAEALGAIDCIAYKPTYYTDGEPAPAIESDYGTFDNAHVLLVGRFKQRPTREESALRWHNFTRVLGNLGDPELHRPTKIDVFFPYYWLGRQHNNPRTDTDQRIRDKDKGKDRGHYFSARILKALGADRVLTFNPHFHRDKGVIYEPDLPLPVLCLDAIPAMTEYAKSRLGSKTVIIGPDFKSSSTAELFARTLGLTYKGFLRKDRLSDSVVHHHDIYDMEGLNVVLFDDIFSTGGTAEGTVRNGIRNPGLIYVYVIHPVMPPAGHEKAATLTRNLIRELVATNTVHSDYSVVDVIPTVARFYDMGMRYFSP